jgi:hypothetical protein
MLSVDRTQTKKQTFAFVVACLLNVAFLFFIFLSELNKNALLNEHLFYEHDMVLDLLDEQPKTITEKSEKSESSEYEDDAGLMVRGNPDGTVPPSLFSHYQSYASAGNGIDEHAEQNEYSKSVDQELANQTTEKTNFKDATKDQNKETEREFSNEQQSLIARNESSSPNLSIAAITKKIISHSSKRRKGSAQNTPSLAQITRNALQNVQSKGNAAIFMSGDQNKPPSELQLIEEHYWAKIESIWNNSFKILKDQLTATPYGTMAAIVELLYQSDGYIKNISLIRSSGNSNIDEFIMNVFDDALPNFPPKPTSLRKPNDEKRQCTVHLRFT